MPKVFDTDIVETSATTGPGTYTLLGPVAGYRSFDEGFNTSDTPYYVVRNDADTKYEHNRGGVFTSGTNTLSRNVYLSSNGNAPVAWVAGDLPLLIYIPSATEILEDIVKGFRSGTRSVWLQTGLWWKSDFPTAGKDTMMYYDGATDVVLVEEEGGTAFFHNHPPGEYVDVAYAVTAGLEPRGTLIADGVAVSRTTYSKLFAKLATTHGAGNGTTTFNKPDARGRDKVARDNQGGTTAGVIDAAYYGASVTANGTKGGFKGHTGGVGVSVSVSVSGSASGTVSVVTNSFSMDGPNSVHNASDQAINTFNAASDGHTHANVQSAGSTGATLGVGASGSGSGGTAAFTIMQPGIIVDTLITTGGQ